MNKNKIPCYTYSSIFKNDNTVAILYLFLIHEANRTPPPQALRGYRKESSLKELLRGGRRGRRRPLGWRREPGVSGHDSDQDVQILSESRPRLEVR